MNIRLYAYTIIITLIPFLDSCRQPSGGSEEFTVECYTPEYASGFSITGAPGRSSVIVNTLGPWQGADSIVTQLFIARNGEKAPADFKGRVITDEARRIVTMSSTHVAMLDALGLTDRIVAVSGKNFITNPDIAARRDEIIDVGYDGNYNYELLIAANPDLVLLYGIYGASQLESKLDELKIPYIYIGDYIEESPLGKAEWVMALAEVTGSIDRGHNAWDSIPQRYNALKAKVAESALDAPSVMLNTPYGDSWFMPPTGSYQITLLNDAGAEYIYKDNDTNTSLPIDMEQAYLLTASADMWLNVGQLKSIEEVKKSCPKMADTRVVKNGYIYNNTLRVNEAGGNDFYESGIMHPDLVLHDLVKIFHPELVDDTPFYYYTKLD